MPPRFHRLALFVSLGMHAIAVWSPLHAQTPAVSSVSPRDPLNDQVVTIVGSNLLPDGWLPRVRYQRKYASGTTEVNPAGASASSITFRARADMRPDGIRLVYVRNDGAPGTAVTLATREFALPSIHVRVPPDLADDIATRSTPEGYRFAAAGSLTLGGFHLNPPPVLDGSGISMTSATSLQAPTSSQPALASSPVTFNGTALPVVARRYVPGVRDEVDVTVPSTIAHNTTGYLRLSTSTGADSVRLTVLQAPTSARVVKTYSSPTTITTNQISRNGGLHEIRGRNLVARPLRNGSVAPVRPELRMGGVPISLVDDNWAVGDTIVRFNLANQPQVTGGELTISHPGGSTSLGTWSVISMPALTISAAVASPSEVVGGSSTTVTASLGQAITDFSNAGEIVFLVPPELANVVIPPAQRAVTANPMALTLQTRAVSAPVTGTLLITHISNTAAQKAVTITVRPPRPVALTLPDTVFGGSTPGGSVAFDAAGAVDVVLSSSDPTTVAVPSPLARRTLSGNATFQLATQQVSTPRPVTISASVAGTSVQRTVIVAPGRIASVVAPADVVGGDSASVTIGFNVPVTAMPVTFTSSDTAIRVPTMPLTANGSAVTVKLATSLRLLSERTVTITATAGGVARSAAIRVRPVRLATFAIAPAQAGAKGGTLTATVTLSDAVRAQQYAYLTSSDTTVATVPSSLWLRDGEITKVLPVTIRPGAAAGSATIEIRLAVPQGASSLVVSTSTATVTRTP